MNLLEQSLFCDGLLNEEQMKDLFDIVINTEIDKIKKDFTKPIITEKNNIDPELLNYPNMYFKYFITYLYDLNNKLNTDYLKKLIKEKRITINFDDKDNIYDFKKNILHFKKDDHFEKTIFRQLFNAIAPNIAKTSLGLNSGISEVLNETYFINTKQNDDYNKDFISPFVTENLLINYCNDDLPGIIKELDSNLGDHKGIELIALINLINKLMSQKDTKINETSKYNMIAIAKNRIEQLISIYNINKKMQ